MKMRKLVSFTLVLLIGIAITMPLTGHSQIYKPGSNAQKDKLNAISTDTSSMSPAIKRIGGPADSEAAKLYAEGNKKGKAGDFRGAIDDYSMSLSHAPSGNCHIKRGFAYLMIDNYPMAIEDFNTAITMNDQFNEAYLGRGISKFEMKDYQAAETDLTRYLQVNKKNAMAYNYMAGIDFLKQRYQESLNDYSEVIKLDSTYPDAYINRGMMRHYLRDFKGAIQDYDVAIRQNPKRHLHITTVLRPR